jgi:ABC-type transport system substrate-binding protein
MSTNYATEKVTAAIRKHLTAIDAVPPQEVTRLAGEITEIVWSELGYAGLSKETLETFFVATNPRTRAQGKA